MGGMLKNEDDLVTLRIDGDGPIGSIVVTADSRGEVKGFAANPSVMLPPSPAGKLPAEGTVVGAEVGLVKGQVPGLSLHPRWASSMSVAA